MKNKVFIITEASVNHNGSVELSKKLIDTAKDSGVDVVKFQIFKVEKLLPKDSKKATYQKENMSDNDDNQFNMLKKLELDIDTHNVSNSSTRESIEISEFIKAGSVLK